MILFALVLGLLSPAPGAAPGEDRRTGQEAQAPKAARWTLDEIFDAIREVESGGSKSGGRRSIGDGGLAIGPYQIHRPYWEDSRVPGKFEDCREPAYARKVMLAYWRRYCPKALDAEDAERLARVHNGGPDGHKEECTKVFWRKVERKLVERREKVRREREKQRKQPVLVHAAVSIETWA